MNSSFLEALKSTESAEGVGAGADDRSCVYMYILGGDTSKTVHRCILTKHFMSMRVY